MIEVENIILSDDIIDNYFVCDLIKCKGACCVEGDLGAPLENSELETIESIVDKVKPYLMKAGVESIEKNGPYILDEDGDYSTTTIDGKECAFAYYDEGNVLKCGIEKAYLEKKIEFRKPISCHLYPIRAKKYEKFTALNYDRWDICSPACDHGKALKVPLYTFLKTPLIHAFGEKWYGLLLEAIKTQNSQDKIIKN